MPRPSLTVVTICFNNPEDLRQTLETLVGLSDRVEKLVIDGSSDDRCAQVSSQFADVAHVQERDDGKYDAMNRGIALARGQSVLFLNSGDALASTAALERLLDRYGDDLDTAIVYGDCRRSAMGREVAIVAPEPTPENLRVGSLASHQSTLIPRDYHARHLYDAKMFYAADTLFLKQAYRDLPSFHFPEAIGIFSHGGASTSPGSVAMLYQQYRELCTVHECTLRERVAIIGLLARRKLSRMVLGESRFQHWQMERLMRKSS